MRATQHHVDGQFLVQLLNNGVDSFGTAQVEPIEDRVPDSDNVGTAGKRLEHMRASANTAVKHDRHTLVDDLCDRRQHIERCLLGIQLASARIGYPDGIRPGLDNRVGIVGGLNTRHDDRQIG